MRKIWGIYICETYDLFFESRKFHYNRFQIEEKWKYRNIVYVHILQ